MDAMSAASMETSKVVHWVKHSAATKVACLAGSKDVLKAGCWELQTVESLENLLVAA